MNCMQLQGTDFKSRVLKLHVDCSASHTWCELDAILLIGKLTNIGESIFMHVCTLHNDKHKKTVQYVNCKLYESLENVLVSLSKK